MPSAPHGRHTMNFEDLKLAPAIVKAVREQGYETPTAIQAQAIPVVLDGHDLLGGAQTGTGKTAAFVLPILHKLSMARSAQNKFGGTGIRALVLTPTRELAAQVEESVQTYGKFLQLSSTVIFGGVGMSPQISRLKKGVDILVATPGRLLDLLGQGVLDLGQVQILVLDEADRMLDMGFVHDVKKVIAQLPPRRQSLFFSATMPPEIVKLAGTILTNPVSVSVTPESTTAETVEQKVYLVETQDKRDLLVQLLSAKTVKTALVFARTKHGADKVAKFLNQAGIKADAIHGNKAQNARQRALASFKDQTITALVATDIAARGIDVSSLELVINYELPNVPETYVHRIGRTGRAGASGLAVSFCDTEEREYLRDIQKLIGKSLPIETDNPFASNNLSSVDKPQPKSGGGQKMAVPGGRSNNGRSGGGGNRPQQSNGRSSQQNGRGGEDAQRDEFVRPPQSHQSQPRQELEPREGTQQRSPRPGNGLRPGSDPRTGGPGGGGPRPATPARSSTGRQNRSGGSGSGYGGGSSDPFSY